MTADAVFFEEGFKRLGSANDTGQAEADNDGRRRTSQRSEDGVG
jgi:hypothetical protein